MIPANPRRLAIVILAVEAKLGGGALGSPRDIAPTPNIMGNGSLLRLDSGAGRE